MKTKQKNVRIEPPPLAHFIKKNQPDRQDIDVDKI